MVWHRMSFYNFYSTFYHKCNSKITCPRSLSTYLHTHPPKLVHCLITVGCKIKVKYVAFHSRPPTVLHHTTAIKNNEFDRKIEFNKWCVQKKVY